MLLSVYWSESHFSHLQLFGVLEPNTAYAALRPGPGAECTSANVACCCVARVCDQIPTGRITSDGCIFRYVLVTVEVVRHMRREAIVAGRVSGGVAACVRLRLISFARGKAPIPAKTEGAKPAAQPLREDLQLLQPSGPLSYLVQEQGGRSLCHASFGFGIGGTCVAPPCLIRGDGRHPAGPRWWQRPRRWRCRSN